MRPVKNTGRLTGDHYSCLQRKALTTLFQVWRHPKGHLHPKTPGIFPVSRATHSVAHLIARRLIR
jgi:hypothetical protein